MVVQKTGREIQLNMQPVTWSPGMTLEALERQAILAAFQFYGRNKTATAQSLGIAIRTLDHKLERYSSDDEEHTDRDAAIRARHRDFERRSRGVHPSDGFDTAESIANQDKQRQANGAQTNQRIHPQPAATPSAQHVLPVPERGEVQEVLPSKVAASGHAKRR